MARRPKRAPAPNHGARRTLRVQFAVAAGAVMLSTSACKTAPPSQATSESRTDRNSRSATVATVQAAADALPPATALPGTTVPVIAASARSIVDMCSALLIGSPTHRPTDADAHLWSPGIGGVGAVLDEAGVIVGSASLADRGALARATNALVTFETDAAGLPRDVAHRILAQGTESFRACYGCGLLNDPHLSGTVIAKVDIGETGGVTRVTDAGSRLRADNVVTCIERSIGELAFPSPEVATAHLTVRMRLEPKSDASAK
jgi:hypothetical protein